MRIEMLGHLQDKMKYIHSIFPNDVCLTHEVSWKHNVAIVWVSFQNIDYHYDAYFEMSISQAYQGFDVGLFIR